MNPVAARIDAYEMALEDNGLPLEHRPFQEWLYQRRPDLKNHELWYGEALVQRGLVTTHEESLKQILAWLDEFESAVPAQR